MPTRGEGGEAVRGRGKARSRFGKGVRTRADALARRGLRPPACAVPGSPCFRAVGACRLFVAASSVRRHFQSLAVVLAQPPCSLLEAEVLSYARGALENGCSLEEAAEVLGPFLLDARLARDEAEALELLSAARGGGSTTSGRGRGTDHDREGGLLAAPVSIASLSSCGGAATAGFADELPLEGVQAEARRAGEGAARLSAARRAARASEAVVRALAPGQLLELWGAGADEEAVAILARALRSEWDSWAGGCDPDFLAASFFAYCAESLAEALGTLRRHPS
ncbi:unnamed protein product [Prorocentrum cordatum]|uniref:Uncharacterized protein n=1 Tax=Prorocentrum cordatum TaxID=2364126 RepID=A0ABN9T279_9DINO|nr:unnamed protein product [Polarella glacialis]